MHFMHGSNPIKADEKLNVKELVRLNEQWFEHGQRRIPYLFFQCDGKPARKKLLISFGAWGGGYNRIRGYLEELRGTHDFLFLQDNHGPDTKGLWYLAENGDFSLNEAYTALIAMILEKSHPAREDVWLLGSSMGGFAALYFAFKFNMGRVVAICPLIAIGSIYKGSADLYKYIMGESGVDADEYIFKNFDKTVTTESHIFFCREDDMLIRGQIGHLISLFIKNKNKFTLESYDVFRPEGVSAHNAAVAIHGRQAIISVFNKSLSGRYTANPE